MKKKKKTPGPWRTGHVARSAQNPLLQKKVIPLDIDNWEEEEEETLRWEETLPKLRLLHAARPLSLSLTMCGSWMLARLLMSDWLRLASSCSSESFCSSMALFSSSMDLRLVSMVVIWQGGGDRLGCYVEETSERPPGGSVYHTTAV